VRQTTCRRRNSLRAWLVLLAALVLMSPIGAQGEPAAGIAYVIEVRGPITPVTEAYITRAIGTAEANGAGCLIIRLDTPGGSLSITREIVERIQGSAVPVIVYVAPSGATAASAGTIITLAAHAAAMAPGTSIGAASPVSGQGTELPETEKRKAENIVIADLKALTERRGPEVQEWARKAVREAAALSANEAEKLGVVDAVVSSDEELLQTLNGLPIVVEGREAVLETAGLSVQSLNMNGIEQFLHTILDPNIAFILMTLGINALLLELSSPGGYVAGVIGVVCLVLGLFALGVLSVNWAGLGLIALSFILFAADVVSPTHGILTGLALVCFVLGSLVLFNSPLYRVSRVLIATVAVFTAVFFLFVLGKVIAARRRPAVTGTESMVGSLAKVRQDIDPEGTVMVRGELWRARSKQPIPAGKLVRIVATRGLLLEVEPVEEASGASA